MVEGEDGNFEKDRPPWDFICVRSWAYILAVAARSPESLLWKFDNNKKSLQKIDEDNHSTIISPTTSDIEKAALQKDADTVIVDDLLSLIV